MKQTLTAQRDVIIFDNDGVFYSWNIFGGKAGAKKFCAEVKADSLAGYFPALSREAIMELGTKSYNDTGDGLRYFVDIAADHGHDPETFREEMSIAYHQLQLRRVQEHYPEVLAACSETTHHFNALSNRVRFGVLSQGCRDNWIQPVLERKNLRHHFHQDHIFGFKEFGWHEKATSPKGIGMLMERMGAHPSRVIFVEDTKKNLLPTKKEYPEVLTIHIEDWETAEAGDHYIDIAVPTNVAFLRQFRAAHLGMTPRLQSPSNDLGLRL